MTGLPAPAAGTFPAASHLVFNGGGRGGHEGRVQCGRAQSAGPGSRWSDAEPPRGLSADLMVNIMRQSDGAPSRLAQRDSGCC